jgi:hypothetical protein
MSNKPQAPWAVNYRQAHERMQAAERLADNFLERVEANLLKLRDWKMGVIRASGLPSSPQAVGGEARTFLAKDWPTAQELDEACVAWRLALEALRVTWIAIPLEDRSRVDPHSVASD